MNGNCVVRRTGEGDAVAEAPSDQFDPVDSGSRDDGIGHVELDVQVDAGFAFFDHGHDLVQLQPRRALLVDAQDPIARLDASGSVCTETNPFSIIIPIQLSQIE